MDSWQRISANWFIGNEVISSSTSQLSSCYRRRVKFQATKLLSFTRWSGDAIFYPLNFAWCSNLSCFCQFDMLVQKCDGDMMCLHRINWVPINKDKIQTQYFLWRNAICTVWIWPFLQIQLCNSRRYELNILWAKRSNIWFSADWF